jgi:hypothetical protein
MSSILYYSNYCEKSKGIISTLGKSNIKDSIHYICIDRREKDGSGNTYVLLENSQKVVLPPSINKVPALLLLNQGHRVVFGNDILQTLQPREMTYNKEVVNNIQEPDAFSFGGGGGNYGVSSDSYSFWDQSSDDLMAQGEGGMRQLYNYATINSNNTIETPPDTYTPDKIGDVSLEQLQQQRNTDFSKK